MPESSLNAAVPAAGVEPARACAPRLAKPLRLPFPPRRHRAVADRARARRPERGASQVRPSRGASIAIQDGFGVPDRFRWAQILASHPLSPLCLPVVAAMLMLAAGACEGNRVGWGAS